MNIIDFELTGNSFTGTVLKGKHRFKLTGTFKTSYEQYPEELDAPLYASTVNFVLTDKQGQVHEITEPEHQELEEILDDKIDTVLEANPQNYPRK